MNRVILKGLALRTTRVVQRSQWINPIYNEPYWLTLAVFGTRLLGQVFHKKENIILGQGLGQGPVRS